VWVFNLATVEITVVSERAQCVHRPFQQHRVRKQGRLNVRLTIRYQHFERRYM
jgi:hypothetical protein